MSKAKYLWMKVTRDEFEFPILLCDSSEELAEKCGTTANNIRSQITHHERNPKRFKHCCYKRVPIEEGGTL